MNLESKRTRIPAWSALLFVVIVVLILAKQGASEEPATGRSGMVSSAHPLATGAGLKILQSGGNAFDAAVAVAAALNVTAPPPANSFPALVRLGLMSRFNNQDLRHNTTAFLHRFAEVTKHGFWTRLRYALDPFVGQVPLDMLLSTEYWQQQVDLIDLEAAAPFNPPGAVPPGDSHTTHFVVADRWGNVVSATQTLGNSFGSRIMPEGTGIWLNNSLAYSTFEPKGNPMDAFPGRHKLSGDVPVLVMMDGRPVAALGTPGGHTIGQTVPQMIMNIIDFGMNIHDAIAAPRISFVEPDVLVVERGIPENVLEELAAMGHKVRIGGGLGNAHALTVEYDSEGVPVRFTGAADPRGSGLARGY